MDSQGESTYWRRRLTDTNPGSTRTMGLTLLKRLLQLTVILGLLWGWPVSPSYGTSFQAIELSIPLLHIPSPLMTKDEIIALERQKAGEHGLDPALVCAVIEQESAFDTMALRMEPGFERRYIKNLHLGPSESVLRATSFGLMQVMGEVARENGFKGDFDDLCCKPE